MVDLAAGRKPHAKTELTVQAKLVDAATEVSYSKAGKGIWSAGSSEFHVSGQTVMNTILPHLRGKLWKAVINFDLKGVKQVLKEAKKAAATDGEQKRVAKCRTYLVGNWQGILAWQEQAERVVGCSAEGHVSHVLSARLSSRPMAWSEKEGFRRNVR